MRAMAEALLETAAILVVEDEPGDFVLIRTCLRSSGAGGEAAAVTWAKAALFVKNRLRRQAMAKQTAAMRIISLTNREREVMLLAVDGLPNKEIARSLGISHRTVEIHKSRVLYKTGADSLLDLARIAEASGMRDEGDLPASWG